METALTILAIVFLTIGVGRILQRKEDYEVDLEFAVSEKRDAVLRGDSPDSYNERITEIQKRGYGDWKERLKLTVVSWTLIAIGLLLLLIEVTMHIDRDPSWNPWGVLAFVLVWIGGTYLYYRFRTHLFVLDARS